MKHSWIIPLFLYVIGASLLLWTANSNGGLQLAGSDVHLEQFFANSAKNGWNTTLPHAYNSSPALTVIAPIFGIWSFKILFPLIFAFVPVLLYEMYHKLTNRMIAFLSAMFFIIVPTFAQEMPAIGRQEFGEFFMVMGLGLMVVGSVREKWVILASLILAVLFAYSLAPIILIYAFAFITVFLVAKRWKSAIYLSVGCVLLVGVAYLYFSIVADGIVIKSFIHPGAPSNVMGGVPGISVPPAGLPPISAPPQVSLPVISAPVDSGIKAGLGLDFFQADIWGKVFRIVQLLTEVLVGIGTILIFTKKHHLALKALTLGGSLLLIMALIFPSMVSALNMARIYHLALIGLAPALVIAGIWIQEKGVRLKWIKK
jgi:uncharacterized membrane protein